MLLRIGKDKIKNPLKQLENFIIHYIFVNPNLQSRTLLLQETFVHLLSLELSPQSLVTLLGYVCTKDSLYGGVYYVVVEVIHLDLV